MLTSANKKHVNLANWDISNMHTYSYVYMSTIWLLCQTIPISCISYSSFALVSIILASQPGQYLLKFSSLFLTQSVNEKYSKYKITITHSMFTSLVTLFINSDVNLEPT